MQRFCNISYRSLFPDSVVCCFKALYIHRFLMLSSLALSGLLISSYFLILICDSLPDVSVWACFSLALKGLWHNTSYYLQKRCFIAELQAKNKFTVASFRGLGINLYFQTGETVLSYSHLLCLFNNLPVSVVICSFSEICYYDLIGKLVHVVALLQRGLVINSDLHWC